MLTTTLRGTDIAISANSRSALIAGLVEQLLRVEDSAACFCWFSRVPSPSNPADEPSRGDIEKLVQLGDLVCPLLRLET